MVEKNGESTPTLAVVSSMSPHLDRSSAWDPVLVMLSRVCVLLFLSAHLDNVRVYFGRTGTPQKRKKLNKLEYIFLLKKQDIN